MIKPLIAIALVLAGGVYYTMFYPPVILKRETKAALASFAEAVATKDRTQISGSLKSLLTDDAKISLEVNFFAIGNQRPAQKQDFIKEQFITFIDNTLYPLTDYMYDAKLTGFKLADDRASAQVNFTSKEWADGTDLYGGVSINMRFSSETACEGTVLFAGDTPRINQLSCSMQFRSIPKPGEAERLNNMEGLRDVLIKNR